MFSDHKSTTPSASQDAMQGPDSSNDSVAWGWNTMEPTRSLWPANMHKQKHHNFLEKKIAGSKENFQKISTMERKRARVPKNSWLIVAQFTAQIDKNWATLY